MTTPPPAQNQSKDQSAVVLEAGFEIAVQTFWEKNRHLILLVCTVALLVIIGREGWQYFTIQREMSVRADYAKVADRPEQLAVFAGANPDHALAGVAYLRLADNKYAAGDFRAAAENYKKAAASLQHSVLLGRARVGSAMSQYYSGDKAAGEAALKAIGTDSSLPKGARVEADYHLATLALEAGNAAEVSRLVAETSKIDAGSVWSQRATALLSVKSE
jgi:predicted negative regulator of RcsB-dependent stress response